jgi:hypothetical protein
MTLGPKNLQDILADLSRELEVLRETRSLTICGGAALVVLNVVDRATRDVDVIIPMIDPALKAAAIKVGQKHRLEEDWLNDKAAGFVRELSAGWRSRSQLVFQGSALSVFVLGRSDLIATKLLGLCDRDERDLEDLLALKPSWPEIEAWRDWLLSLDGGGLWPERVQKQLAKLQEAVERG